MGQRVVLKIAGKEYELDAATPEMEQTMRVAAADVNEMLEMFNTRFPDASMVDKFAFVAVHEAIEKFYVKKEVEAFKSEMGSLHDELGSYLDGKDKK